MNVLVTGGSGFIGSHLVERLLRNGHSVIVLDNLLTGHLGNLDHLFPNRALQIVDHDCTKPFDTLFDRQPIQAVFNLASPASPRGYSRFPIETLRVNSEGTFNALSVAAAHGARFVQASTSEVYGDPLVHPQHEHYWGNVNPVGPRACYDEGKRFAESMAMVFHRERGLDVRIARIFNTYGPRSQPADGRVVPNFCTQALAGKPITVYGDGSQTRSFCYVDDLVDGLIRLMTIDGIGGEVVNLGNPDEYTILEFAERIIELTESNSKITFEPLPEDDPIQRKPVIDRASQLLGWSPSTGLDTGLRRTLEFFSTGSKAIYQSDSNGHVETRMAGYSE